MIFLRWLQVVAVLLCVVGFASSLYALEAVVQRENTAIVAGQPFRIAVRVRGASGVPDVQPPVIDGATLTPLGQFKPTPSMLRGSGTKGSKVQSGGKASGQASVEALRGMTGKMTADLQQAGLGQGGIDPNLMRQYQAALSSLGTTKGNEYTFVFKVQTDNPGPLVIPAFTVSADGQTAETRPISVEVGDPRGGKGIADVKAGTNKVRVAVSLSKPNPQAGDQVDLYVDLLVQRAQVNVAGRSYPYLPLASMHISMPPFEQLPGVQLARPLEQIVQDHLVPAGHRGFQINAIPGEMTLENEPAEKDPAGYRRRLTVPLRLKEAGTITVPSIHVAGEVFVPSSDALGRQPVVPGAVAWEPFAFNSAPLTFEVRPGSGQSNQAANAIANKAPDADPASARDNQTAGLDDEEAPRFTWAATLPYVGTALALLAAGLCVAEITRRWKDNQKRIAQDRSKETAAATALRRLGKSQPTAEYVRIVFQEFLRRRFGMPPGEIMPLDALERLGAAGVEDATAQACADVLEKCAAVEFSSGVATESTAELAAAAQEVVRKLAAGPRMSPRSESKSVPQRATLAASTVL